MIVLFSFLLRKAIDLNKKEGAILKAPSITLAV